VPASKVVVTGYPVRPEFFRASRLESRARLGIPGDVQVLFVFGASQGSRNINQALAACLPDLLQGCYVLHSSGEQRLDEARAAAGDLLHNPRYRLFPYLSSDQMADALAAADLALCRSGASVMGELPATGTPAVLVPLPITSVHQLENAAFLARNGAALVLTDEEMPARLCALLTDLLDDPERLARMSAAARALARSDAARRISDVVREAA
jgi:UDP-N-acetylglucosamine--N-acetylmuramyl-(pentapeptide) pyrophosphoryl-undecaprenol N-acetylglucosamine transferase